MMRLSEAKLMCFPLSDRGYVPPVRLQLSLLGNCDLLSRTQRRSQSQLTPGDTLELHRGWCLRFIVTR